VGVHHEHPHYKWWVLSCTSLHVALWTLAIISLAGAGVSLLRPKHVRHEATELRDAA